MTRQEKQLLKRLEGIREFMEKHSDAFNIIRTKLWGLSYELGTMNADPVMQAIDYNWEDYTCERWEQFEFEFGEKFGDYMKYDNYERGSSLYVTSKWIKSSGNGIKEVDAVYNLYELTLALDNYRGGLHEQVTSCIEDLKNHKFVSKMVDYMGYDNMTDDDWRDWMEELADDAKKLKGDIVDLVRAYYFIKNKIDQADKLEEYLNYSYNYIDLEKFFKETTLFVPSAIIDQCYNQGYEVHKAGSYYKIVDPKTGVSYLRQVNYDKWRY